MHLLLLGSDDAGADYGLSIGEVYKYEPPH
jgi:hypothetical protein